MAERQIEHLKRELSILCGLNETVVWSDFVRNVVAHHNAQFAGGTTFTRASVTDANFNEYMSEKLKVPDASLRYNTNGMDITGMPPSWGRKLFKFALGDTVLITADSDWTKKKKAPFYKKSVDGTFSSILYTVVRAALRNTRDKAVMVPGEMMICAKAASERAGGRRGGGAGSRLNDSPYFSFSAVYKVQAETAEKALAGWFYTEELREFKKADGGGAGGGGGGASQVRADERSAVHARLLESGRVLRSHTRK